MRLHSISSTAVALFTATALITISTLSTIVATSNAWFELNENQIMYLYSTSAQVIAAVYGLTLTGYLFFRSELLREARNDETRAVSIEKVEGRYLKQLIVITLLVGLTIILTNLIIAQEGAKSTLLLTALMNTAQTSFAISFAAISVFVLDVVTPHNVEAASQAIQNEIDPGHSLHNTEGSLENFLRIYNEIERVLVDTTGSLKPFIEAMDSSPKYKRTSNVRLAEMLWRGRRIKHHLFTQLKDLITLRNAIIHGAEPVVSREMVDKSQVVLLELREALQDTAPSKNAEAPNYL
ncbi:hypothetical protein [Pseudomonas oryzicola]|uniref:RiboL-PSP-HEPN domain-containing protein n=1 Tax=Pseudomonas oryzicola TaxID=485876 RepID=A0ABS6Q758_9PSED|nr:hypothetical protein [Pseudomonas oryzicola]MBV4489783.1 hypothetical protein [Pseudomonas oryzicola]